MTRKLGVLVIHGMGDQKADFADALQNGVDRRLGAAAAAVQWMPVWWAPVLEGRETRLLATVSGRNRLDFMCLRRFVVHFLGDAIAYQRVPSLRRRDMYEAIHDVVATDMHRLRNEIRAGGPADAPEAPLVVVAHSLGAHIASNYLWDLRPAQPSKKRLKDDNPFERGETLAGMVTMGCNIPLYTLAYSELEPIAFPSVKLRDHFPPGTDPERLKLAAQWLNLYDRDDVLAYPLKPLNEAYCHAVTEDVQLNVGGIFKSWNPLSHDAYWTNGGVAQRIADLIRGLLELLC